jgi:hypothetical protein
MQLGDEQMEERCVINYHQLELLKSLLDHHYGTNLSRDYLKGIFNGSEVVNEIQTYGVRDPIVFANAQLMLAKALGVPVREIGAQLLESQSL